MASFRHGTLSGYYTDRCRCWKCKLANTAYHREWERRKRWLAMGLDFPSSGWGLNGRNKEANKKSVAEIRAQQIARRDERAAKIQKLLDERK